MSFIQPVTERVGEQLFTVKELAKELRQHGLFVHIKNPNTLIVNYHFVTTDDELDSDTVVFEGTTVEELVNEINAWYINPKLWIDEDKYLIVKHDDSFELDIELMALGFNEVAVIHEETNFVSIRAKYLSKEEGENFIFDGVLLAGDVGDKYVLYRHVKEWMKRNPMKFISHVKC